MHANRPIDRWPQTQTRAPTAVAVTASRTRAVRAASTNGLPSPFGPCWRSNASVKSAARCGPCSSPVRSSTERGKGRGTRSGGSVGISRASEVTPPSESGVLPLRGGRRYRRVAYGLRPLLPLRDLRRGLEHPRRAITLAAMWAAIAGRCPPHHETIGVSL